MKFKSVHFERCRHCEVSISPGSAHFESKFELGICNFPQCPVTYVGATAFYVMIVNGLDGNVAIPAR